MDKKQILAEYHILYLKQIHRKEWCSYIEEKMYELGSGVEHVTRTRINTIYTLFNDDKDLAELDVLEKGKVVAKLVKNGNFVDVTIKKQTKWVEIKNVPLSMIKFQGA